MTTTFDISLSVNFRGGQPFAKISADNYKEFVEKLRQCWRRSGITSSTGEMFVYSQVRLQNQSTPIDIECGYFVFIDSEFSPRTKIGFNEEVDNFWEMNGIDHANADEDEIFEKKIHLLLHPNCPQRVIGKWIKQLINEDYESDFESFVKSRPEFHAIIEDAALAEILHFSSSHGKSVEMLQWLASAEAEDLLQEDQYSPLGSEICAAADKLLTDLITKNLSTYIEKSSLIQKFITANKANFSHPISLNHE